MMGFEQCSDRGRRLRMKPKDFFLTTKHVGRVCGSTFCRRAHESLVGVFCSRVVCEVGSARW
jgi:hypothetical protein